MTHTEHLARRRHRSVIVAVSTLLVLTLLSACTSDSKQSAKSTASSTSRPSTATASVAGCATGSWTNPQDLSGDRQPARCQAGTPAPKPLAEHQTLRVVLNNLSSEYVAPMLYAVQHGEFAKENIEVKLETIPVTDAFPLLANGTIDALYSGPNAGFINAVAGGFQMKWVLGNFFPDAKSQTGLWVAVNKGDSTNRADLLRRLKGATMGSVAGPGTVVSYPIAKALKEVGLSLTDLQVKTLPFADIVTALKNHALYAGWVVDPLWRQLQNDPSFQFLIAQPAGEPLGGTMFGAKMYQHRDVAEAFVRAWIRTINTYFSGDYKSNPAFVTELAKMLKLPENILAETPSLRWDWELRDGTITRMEDAYVQEKSINKSLPEDQLVDRSFYEEAVGHRG